MCFQKCATLDIGPQYLWEKRGKMISVEGNNSMLNPFFKTEKVLGKPICFIQNFPWSKEYEGDGQSSRNDQSGSDQVERDMQRESGYQEHVSYPEMEKVLQRAVEGL